MGRKVLNDLAGEYFGYLVAIKIDHVRKRQGAYWLCKCTRCDREVVVSRSHLLFSSPKRTCGCNFGFLTAVSKATGYSKSACSLVLRNKGEYSKATASIIREAAKKLKHYRHHKV